MRRKSSVLTLFCIAAGIAGALWLTSRPRTQPEARARIGDAMPAASAPPELAVQPNRASALPPRGSIAGAPEEAASSADTGVPESNSGMEPIRIRVMGGGVPIEGAVVRARLEGDDLRPLVSSKTGETGLASLDPTTLATRASERGRSGRSDVVYEAFAEGYRVAAMSGSRLEKSRDGCLEFALDKGVPFEGRVFDAVTSLPIAGASVVVTDRSDDLEVGPTDQNGAFHVPAVMNDHEAPIVARAPGHVAERITVRVDGGKPQPAEAVLRLEPGASLVGVVRSADGTPVPGAVVHVQPQWSVDSVGVESAPAPPADDIVLEPDAVRRYEFDDDILDRPWRSDGVETFGMTAGTGGAFQIDGLRIGTAYEASASAPGHSSSPLVRGLHVGADGAGRPVTLTLRRSATVLVRIAVPAGSTVPATPRVRLFLLRDDTMCKPVSLDSEGRFRFGDVDPGRVNVLVQADGFRSAVKSLAVVEGAISETTVALESGGTVEGVVVSADGSPVAGANVEVAPATGNGGGVGRCLFGSRKTWSGAQGRFLIGGVPPGDAVLVADWGDCRERHFLGTRARVSLTVPVRDLRVVVSRLATVRIRLLTPDGHPFQGKVWTFSLSSDGSWGSEDVITDGRVEDTRRDDGDGSILVAPDEFAWIRRSFTIHDGTDVDFGDVTLDPGVTVSGRVEDGAGRPVVGATLTFFENDKRSVRTDGEGRFSLNRVPREPVSLRVEADGFCNSAIEVDPTRTSGIEVRVARHATLRGVLKTSGGAALEGRVELRPFGAILNHSSVTGTDGTHGESDWYEGAAWIESDPKGHFEEAISPGRWIGWWVDGTGKERKVGEWTLADGETREIEIVLPEK